jgi:hypothetical protein
MKSQLGGWNMKRIALHLVATGGIGTMLGCGDAPPPPPPSQMAVPHPVSSVVHETNDCDWSWVKDGTIDAQGTLEEWTAYVYCSNDIFECTGLWTTEWEPIGEMRCS